MKKLLVVLTLLGILFCSSLAAAKTVVVTGMGATAAEAENDALRNAIENTVGVLVDSQSLSEKNVVLMDQIYTQSRGFIRNYTVRKKLQQPGGWLVTVEADVDDLPDSKLMTELTRLGIIDTRLRNPKIAVYIPEQHLRYRIPDSAAESAVINTLVDAGFTYVIQASPKLAQTDLHNHAWSLKPLHNMNEEDLRNAARYFEADILIIGEAFSEGVGDVGLNLPGCPVTNTQSCRARAEGKMYMAKTGQIIAAGGKLASGADISEAIASKKALAAAGQKLGDYFVAEIMKLGSGNRQSIELIVKGADFSKVNMIQSALGKVAGVRSSHLSKYEDGEGTFSIIYNGAPQTLFKAMQSAINADLTLVSSGYNTMIVSVL